MASTKRVPGESSAEERIWEVVRAIPRGKVATYGQIARLAGLLYGHRVAARALKTCPKGLPWQRVLGKKDARRAHISVTEPAHAALQRRLLERDGVRFDANGCVSLREYGWQPKASRVSSNRSETERARR